MVTNGKLTVGTTATAVDGVYQGYSNLTIHNDDNTDAVYIGGAAVTTSNGLALQKEQTIQFEIAPLEQLYVVSTKTGHSVSFLRQTI